MTNRFDKPYRNIYQIDSRKIGELFSIASDMNSTDIKRYSLIEKVPLAVTDMNGNNLIHKVLQEPDKSKTEYQRLNMIRFLFNENVNPDAPNSENMTPLHLACMKQYESIVKYLLEIGVNANYQDSIGNNCLHYLLASNFILDRDETKKSLIPLPKRKDTEKIKGLTEARKNIWELIKDSKYIVSIKKTLENSISASSQERSIVAEFQNRIQEQTFNLAKKDDLDKLKELQGISITKFRQILERDWSNFPDINELTIHERKDNTSWPDNYENAIIKNYDYKVDIKNQVDKAIDNIVKETKLVKVTNTKQEIMQELNTENRNALTDFVNIPGLVNFDQTYLEGNMNHKLKYRELNKDRRHPLAVDNADNIIDWDNHTFAGGSRLIEITDELDNDKINQLLALDSLEEKVSNMANTLVRDWNNFNVIGNTDDAFINYIYDVILQKNTLVDTENNLRDLLVAADLLALVQLIEKRQEYDSKSWLYTFINASLCNLDQDTHLTSEMRQALILLVSAYANTETDLELSISQVLRPQLIGDIIDAQGNIDKIYPAWIYCLLSKDKTAALVAKVTIDPFSPLLLLDDNNNMLKSIIELAEKYFDDKTIPNKDDLDWIGIDITKYNSCEVLCAAIMKYYSEMPQKPILQNVVDTISLIRYHYITDAANPSMINRLKTLYLPPLAQNDISNIKGQIKLLRGHYSLDYAEMYRPQDYFKKIFSSSQDIDLLEQITEFQIPSKLNYYISQDKDFFEKQGNLTDTQKLYLLKQIEANHLGLSYLGLIPELEHVDDVPNVNGGAVINTQLNLFGYMNALPPPPHQLASEYFLVATNDQYRPPTQSSYDALLQNFINRLIEMENIVKIVLSRVFTEFKKGNSRLYSKAIVYCYPVLVAVESHKNFLMKIYKSQPTNITSNLDRNINKINGMLYLYYYLETAKDKQVKIPKFIYHQFESNQPFVVFDKEDTPIVYPGNPIEGTDDADAETDTTDDNYKQEGVYKARPVSSYNSFVDDFKNRRFFVSRHIIKNALIQEKNSALPPSLKAVLRDFYKYNTINLILEQFEQTNIDRTIGFIGDELITLPENTRDELKDFQKMYIVAKMIENLVQMMLRDHTFAVGNKIYEQVIQTTDYSKNIKETRNLFDKVEFAVELAKPITENDLEGVFLGKKLKHLLNFYKFSMELHPKEKFIIYPNNYTSTNLLKSKFYSDINDKVLDELINSHCNIFSINIEGETPLSFILKNYHYKVLEKWKTKLPNSRDDNSVELLKQEYVNHLFKFTNGQEKYYDQLKKFTEPQYCEIESMIKGNDDFNNNILVNLDISFVLCNYLTQQYLTKDNTVPTDLYYSDTVNFDTADRNQIFLGKDIDFSTIFPVNINLRAINIGPGDSIISKYDELLSQLNTQRGLYMHGWKKLFKNDDLLKVSPDIKIQKSINDENITTISFANEALSDLAEKYFENPSYIDKNDLLAFTRELLIHLTQNVLCHGIEIIIRKIIFEQLKTTASANTEIVDLMDYIFNYRDGPVKSSIMDVLYDKIALKFVLNSVKVFHNEIEESEHEAQDVEEILTNFFDLLKIRSPIEITEYTFTLLKSNVITYFSTIIPKTINNWNVCIENQLIYVINHYRILKCYSLLNN